MIINIFRWITSLVKLDAFKQEMKTEELTHYTITLIESDDVLN